MKKKSNQILITLCFFLLQFFTWAQDKEVEARIYYTNAESFFSKSTIEGYDKCIEELEKAEKSLGFTNSKILFLKIQAMSKNHTPYYAYDIDTSLKTFFKITDAKSYPIEKYTEIIKVRDDFKNALNIPKENMTPGYRSSPEGLYYKGTVSYGIGEIASSVVKLQISLIKLEIKLYKETAENTHKLYNKRERDAASIKLQELLLQLSKYENELIVEPNYQYSLAWFSKAVLAGHVISNLTIATMIMENKGIRCDYNLALTYYQLAANSNSNSGMFGMGFIYANAMNSDSWSANYIKAAEWYRKAAENGNVSAMCNLIKLHLKEYKDGVSKQQRVLDNIMVIPLLEKAAERNDLDAVEMLDYVYSNGIDGVKRDKEKAKNMTKKLTLLKPNQ